MTWKAFSRTGVKLLPVSGYVSKRAEQLYAPPEARGSASVVIRGDGTILRATVTKQSPERIKVRLDMNAEQRGARIAAVNKRLRAR